MGMRKNKKAVKGVFALLALIIRNSRLRLALSLLAGAVMNILYIITNLLSMFSGGGTWALTVTVYYSVLLIVRLYLFGYREVDVGNEVASLRLYHVCRRVGVFMLLLDFLASAMMIYSVTSGRVVDFRGGYIIGFAVFTVYSLSSSAIGIVRSLKNDSPLSLAARNITLAAALLSVFNLVYSILVSVGISRSVILIANSVVGSFVFLIIISLAVYLIVKSTVKIRTDKSGSFTKKR